MLLLLSFALCVAVLNSASVSQVMEMAAPQGDRALPSPRSHSAAEKHWGVILGGLISLKYLLPLPRTLSECVTGRPEEMFETLRSCLKSANDDVSGAAADLMKSLLIGLQRELGSFDSKEDAAKTAFVRNLLTPMSSYLLHFIGDLNMSVLRLDVLSCRVQPLCGGFTTCCVLLEELMLIWPSVHLWGRGQGPIALGGPGTRQSAIEQSAVNPPVVSHGASKALAQPPSISLPVSVSVSVPPAGPNTGPSLIESSEALPAASAASAGGHVASPLDVTVALTGLLSELLLKLLLYCKDSQRRCLLLLRSGKRWEHRYVCPTQPRAAYLDIAWHTARRCPVSRLQGFPTVQEWVGG